MIITVVGLDIGSTSRLLEWFDLAKSRARYLENLPDEISTPEIHVRLTLDTPPCKSRLVDIRRARDRPEQSTGPLTAP